MDLGRFAEQAQDVGHHLHGVRGLEQQPAGTRGGGQELFASLRRRRDERRIRVEDEGAGFHGGYSTSGLI